MKSPQPWLSSFLRLPQGFHPKRSAGKARTTGWVFSTRRLSGLRILLAGNSCRHVRSQLNPRRLLFDSASRHCAAFPRSAIRGRLRLGEFDGGFYCGRGASSPGSASLPPLSTSIHSPIFTPLLIEAARGAENPYCGGVANSLCPG
jgi:hypothetical protein